MTKKYLIPYEEYEYVASLISDLHHKNLEAIKVIIVDLTDEQVVELREAGITVEENAKAELCYAPAPIQTFGVPPEILAYYNLNSAHTAGVRGTGVRVGLIDTGCSDAAATAVPGVIRLDFTDFGAHNDTFNHGSKGCMVMNQTLDFAAPHDPKDYGIATGCELYSLRAFDGGAASIAAAINFAIENGFGVINMSFFTGSSTAMDNAITAALAAGIIVVVAAGNSLVNPINYPATFPGVIVVNTIDSTTTLLAGSYITADGHTKVTIVNYNGGSAQTFAGGTSQATFEVTALFAVYKQKYPNLTTARAINLIQRRALQMNGYTYNNSIDSTTLATLLNYETGAGFVASLN